VSNIPGLEHLAKEGWKIVGFDNVSQDEWFIDTIGRIVPWSLPRRSNEKKIIIRKIEKPKQYRHFANAAEYAPHRDRWAMHPRESDRRFRTGDYNNDGVWGSDRRFYGYQDLFESGALFDDGSPFGLEVQS
jgi:hypothetical protein